MGYWKEFFNYWQLTHQAFLNMVKRVPGDALDFRPTPENYTLKELLLHIIECEREMTEGIRRGELSEAYLETCQPPPTGSVQEIYEAARKTHEETQRDFSGLSDDELMRPIRVAWLDKSNPAISLLIHAFEELLHHRGQATLYFRLLKLDPVNIYDYSK
ncbi:MAG: DinB family protein [Candidatus Eremiobacteraeota bacterium]|nr:DinB family protein [Candidatus Eremiobacteraeota bacterium]